MSILADEARENRGWEGGGDVQKEITEIIAAINDLWRADTTRVEEIRQRVEAGTYTIDPRKVAEKIFKDIVL